MTHDAALNRTKPPVTRVVGALSVFIISAVETQTYVVTITAKFALASHLREQTRSN